MVRQEQNQRSGGWEMIASMLVENSHDSHVAEHTEEAEITALEDLCDTFGMSIGIDAFEHFMDSRMFSSMERIAAGSCRLGCLATVRARGGERLQARFQQEQERRQRQTQRQSRALLLLDAMAQVVTVLRGEFTEQYHMSTD